MRVRVLFFGILKDAAGRSAEESEWAEGTDLAAIYASYAGRYPRFRDMAGRIDENPRCALSAGGPIFALEAGDGIGRTSACLNQVGNHQQHAIGSARRFSGNDVYAGSADAKSPLIHPAGRPHAPRIGVPQHDRTIGVADSDEVLSLLHPAKVVCLRQ